MKAKKLIKFSSRKDIPKPRLQKVSSAPKITSAKKPPSKKVKLEKDKLAQINAHEKQMQELRKLQETLAMQLEQFKKYQDSAISA